MSISFRFIVAFTAYAVFHNYKEYVVRHLTDYKEADVDLFVSGGGAKNDCLMR